MLIFLLLS